MMRANIDILILRCKVRLAQIEKWQLKHEDELKAESTFLEAFANHREYLVLNDVLTDLYALRLIYNKYNAPTTFTNQDPSKN